MDELQSKWKHLYGEKLPSMARAKDPVQKSWPVHVDHCFGRIVLDNAVGKDKPWMEMVKAPAVKHMTEDQYKAAINLAEKIVGGEASLDELNQRSLELRGKNGPKKRAAKDSPASSPDKNNKRKSAAASDAPSKKSKQDNGNLSTYFLPSPQSPGKVNDKVKDDPDNVSEDKAQTALNRAQQASHTDMNVQLKRISDSKLTTFRKQTLSMLCQIPRGRYSTYQAMSDYITKNSHKTCARAVGNAMRNNPFAPEVPCHRILAADGSLGGFGGSWGEDGKYATEKHRLLDEEGVKFDSRGKVKGPPFRDFEPVE